MEREEVFKIIGMHCASCVLAIQNSLRKLGVEAEVSLASEEARVIFDPNRIRPKMIVDAVRRAGYDVYKEELVVLVNNLDTYDDERHIISSLENVEGVIEINANYISKLVRVVYNPLEIDQKKILNTISSLGYSVSEVKQGVEIEDIGQIVVMKELKRLRNYILITLPLSIFLALYYMLGSLGYEPPLWDLGPLRDLLIGIPLSTTVLVIGSIRFLRPAIRSFINLSPGMDSLVVLGTYSAYIFSVSSSLGMIRSEPFYEASALVISFILLGRYLETKLKIRTGEAVRKLAELQARSARVLRNGSEVEVPINEVRVGDLIIVKPGEKIPVDGILKEGRAIIDESPMTGEVVPVEKLPGDPVFAGTTLLRGSIKVYTTRVGLDTIIGQIMKLVRISQSSKPRIQRIVDRVSGIFTWLIILIALIIFTYWYFIAGIPLSQAVIFSVSVLVVACPCALGLASPTAIIIGFGKGAEHGVLIKDADVIDRVYSGKENSKVVVFDKTGTLTLGKPRIHSIKTIDEIDETEVLKIACVAEKRSEHPLGEAIVEEAMRRGIIVRDPDNFENIPGQGVVAWIGDIVIAVGNEKLINNMEMRLEEDLRRYAEELMREGLTVIYVAVNNKVIGAIGIGDEIRAEAYEVINYFKKRGYRVLILTGDKEITARAIASKLGIDDVIAEVSPESKAEVIEELRRRGYKVIMVGDGINDAASLSKADLGIAMGLGTDIAKESGDVILVKNNLRGVVYLFDLITAIRRKIIHNLAWAFIYNIMLVPIAAGVLYSYGLILRPELAGLAMSMSSISVMLSAQSLRRWRPRYF